MMLPRWHLPPSLQAVSGRQVIERVAALHDVTPEDITGPSRLRRHCEARWQVMRELASKGLSTPTIGRILNRDHSTVVHGLRRAR
jgi:chromosomal replication initiation ATPase DnaA